MPTAYNVSSAAALVGVSPSTLRNWVKQYGAHLSPSANPPPGTDRILTADDVGKLQFVKAQRDALKDYVEIAAELATMPDDTELAPYIDVAPTAPEIVQRDLQPVTVSAELVQALQMIAARQDNDLQRQIDELKERQADAEARAIERYQSYVMGVLSGIIVVLVVLAILWAGAALR